MQYYPGQTPANYDPLWLQSELRRLAETLEQGTDVLRLEVTTVAPSKTVEGMIRRADGTNWDPGNGAGLYVYRDSRWQLIEAGFTANLQSFHFFLGE